MKVATNSCTRAVKIKIIFHLDLTGKKTYEQLNMVLYAGLLECTHSPYIRDLIKILCTEKYLNLFISFFYTSLNLSPMSTCFDGFRRTFSTRKLIQSICQEGFLRLTTLLSKSMGDGMTFPYFLIISLKLFPQQMRTGHERRKCKVCLPFLRHQIPNRIALIAFL